jgi:hypothetical protein
MTTGADWLDQARRLIEAVRGPEPAPDADRGEHAADCSWCPVCQFAAVLRGERPEVTAALADVLTTAAVALREFAAETAPPRQAPVGEPAAGTAEPPPVQRIDIA